MRIKDLISRSKALIEGNVYLAVDDATNNVTQKVDYKTLAREIIEQYNLSTLAGEARSVKAALDWLNTNKYALVGGTAITSGADANTFTTIGNYYVNTNAIAQSLVNFPINATLTMKVESSVGSSNTSYLIQTVRNATTNATYERRRVNNTWTAWEQVPTRAEVNALNSNITIDFSNYHTKISNGSDFNSYTTPGVYYVESDASGATMVNIPRKSSGKLIVMARHTAEYLAQYFYPSTAYFIRYVRSYGGSTWSSWTQQDINYENTSNRQYAVGSISSASARTFEELGLTKYQYGSYFVVLRVDGSRDGTWAGIVRHNSAGYQISEFYKGEATNTPYVTTDGIIKTNSSAAISCYGLVFPINVWGSLLS